MRENPREEEWNSKCLKLLSKDLWISDNHIREYIYLQHFFLGIMSIFSLSISPNAARVSEHFRGQAQFKRGIVAPHILWLCKGIVWISLNFKNQVKWVYSLTRCEQLSSVLYIGNGTHCRKASVHIRFATPRAEASVKLFHICLMPFVMKGNHVASYLICLALVSATARTL